MNTPDLLQRLRDAPDLLRRKAMPLSDFIPLIQQAADAIEATKAQPSPAVEPIRTQLYMAAINCGHEIDADEIRLYRDTNKDGNALSQLADRLDVAQQGAKP